MPGDWRSSNIWHFSQSFHSGLSRRRCSEEVCHSLFLSSQPGLLWQGLRYEYGRLWFFYSYTFSNSAKYIFFIHQVATALWRKDSLPLLKRCIYSHLLWNCIWTQKDFFFFLSGKDVKASSEKSTPCCVSYSSVLFASIHFPSLLMLNSGSLAEYGGAEPIPAIVSQRWDTTWANQQVLGSICTKSAAFFNSLK